MMLKPPDPPSRRTTEALTREVKEETGLEVRGARLLDARTYNVERDHIAWQLVAIVYAIQLDRHHTFGVEEVNGSTDAAAWVPLERISGRALSPVAADSIRLSPGNERTDHDPTP